MSFSICVDVRNPGQFFGACGVFELAFRLDTNALGRFEAGRFRLDASCSLSQLLERLTSTPLVQLDMNDDTSSPIAVGPPFDLRIDWWFDKWSGGRELKVWAGTMQSVRIAEAMLFALREQEFHGEELFNVGRVVRDPHDDTKKVEPYYFDARRAPNAHSRDIGFSPNDLDLTTTAFPAVEFFCLVGLQRYRPARTAVPRVFEYTTWESALPPSVAMHVAAGSVPLPGARTYRFENWFRTGQKKHKAFRPARLVEERTRP
jgi:CRISPR-associated protein Csx14